MSHPATEAPQKPLADRMREAGMTLDGTSETPVSALLDLMLDRLADARLVGMAVSGLQMARAGAMNETERKRILDELLADIPRLLDPASTESVRTDARFRLVGLIPIPMLEAMGSKEVE